MSGFPIKTTERWTLAERLTFNDTGMEPSVIDFYHCGCGCGAFSVCAGDREIARIGFKKGTHVDSVYEGSIKDELFVWDEQRN